MSDRIVSPETIETVIVVLRGHRVILDHVIAEMYGVPVKALNQAVKRNIERFPDDFMIRLTAVEAESLRSQSVTLEGAGRGQHRKYLPCAFTEQGVSMLSSVLKSREAVKVNIEIMRAFVRLRQMLGANAELARSLDALEKKYDAQFKVVFQAIRDLMEPLPRPKRRVGFKAS